MLPAIESGRAPNRLLVVALGVKNDATGTRHPFAWPPHTPTPGPVYVYCCVFTLNTLVWLKILNASPSRESFTFSVNTNSRLIRRSTSLIPGPVYRFRGRPGERPPVAVPELFTAPPVGPPAIAPAAFPLMIPVTGCPAAIVTMLENAYPCSR